MTVDNLWGDLPKLENLKSPRKILQEQADLLSAMTDDNLRGHVRTETAGEEIVHELEVIAPYINNYRTTVLRITHGPVIYPVHVQQGTNLGRSLLCNDSVTLIQALKGVLQSAEVRKLIASLITQSREVR